MAIQNRRKLRFFKELKAVIRFPGFRGRRFSPCFRERGFFLESMFSDEIGDGAIFPVF